MLSFVRVTSVLCNLAPQQKPESHSALALRSLRGEGSKKQVSSQSRRDDSFGDLLLQVRESLLDFWVILEMAEDVLLNQSPHPHLLLGPPSVLQLAAAQHGVPVGLHLGPDFWDALRGVRGGAHHLRMEFVIGKVGFHKTKIFNSLLLMAVFINHHLTLVLHKTAILLKNQQSHTYCFNFLFVFLKIRLLLQESADDSFALSAFIFHNKRTCKVQFGEEWITDDLESLCFKSFCQHH